MMGWLIFISINQLERFTTLLITGASQKLKQDESHQRQCSKTLLKKGTILDKCCFGVRHPLSLRVSLNVVCFFCTWSWGPQGTNEYNDEKRLTVHEATLLSYTHMLLLLSSCHLWSGCHHPIHQICHIDLSLLTGHVFGDGICFMNSFCAVLSFVMLEALLSPPSEKNKR